MGNRPHAGKLLNMPAPKSFVSPWAKLDAIMKADPEPAGPEWFTVEQFTMRYGGSHGGNHAKLRRDKRLERWKGTSADTRRTLTKYRLK